NICLPHAKTEYIDGPVAAMATLKTPVDFHSLDGEPVNICFLLLGKENNIGMHLRLLSKISRFLNNDEFREKILNSKTPDEIINLFESVDE
ncbi:MAG TPA: PTS sugar transporter subunit IIA, partial [Candidatus Kapabacteria bacterium]|nr:PTS sugar transporter subunit IIA [Candidatus Kapabacteria bacterium]